MSTPITVPTISAWSGRQRRSLRVASQATARGRAKSHLAPTVVVLLYALAKTGPTCFRPGEIAAHTGLSDGGVTTALRELEAAGLIEPGAATSGRIGVLVPRVLERLGLDGFGLRLDQVRPDVEPSGSFGEATDQERAQALCISGRRARG